jgi:hypothetical protein
LAVHDYLHAPAMSYSVGFTLPDNTGDLLKLIPDSAWTPAYDADGKARPGAWVAGLAGLLDLAKNNWPCGAGPSPWRRGMVRTEVADTAAPRSRVSPTIRGYPQPGVHLTQGHGRIREVARFRGTERLERGRRRRCRSFLGSRDNLRGGRGYLRSYRESRPLLVSNEAHGQPSWRSRDGTAPSDVLAQVRNMSRWMTARAGESMTAARDRRIHAIWFGSGRSWPTWVPQRVWDVIRVTSVLVSVGLAASLALAPEPMLDVVWDMIVPLVPITLLIVPGLWRNVCPLAAVSQLPRRLGRHPRRAAPSSVMLPASMVLLLVLVTARKVWFNQSGPATAGLIGAAVIVAVLTGLLFRGKSGWCTGMCPLLPVERLYGQTPWIRLGDTQCGSCVSCTRHCPDRRPGAAAMAELASQSVGGKRRARQRLLFAATFPGFVAGYFLVPSVPTISASKVVVGMVSFSVLSGVVFAFLDRLAAQFRFALMAGFAASAISLYYGLGADSFVGTWQRMLGLPPFPWLATLVRVLVWVIALAWWVRSVQRKSVFTRGTTHTTLEAPRRGRRAAYRTPGRLGRRDRRPHRRHGVGTPVLR